MAHSKLYKLNEDKLAEYKAGNQAQLIIKSLMDRSPQTVRQIAEDIKAKLVTRQQPERVVNFYMSTWKNKGIVEVVGQTEEAPVSTGTSSSEVGTGDTAGETRQEIAEEAGNEYAAFQPAESYTEEFDWVNSSLKAAICEVLDKSSHAQTAIDISHTLQIKGRTANPKQVNDAVSKLVKEGKVERTEGGIVLA